MGIISDYAGKMTKQQLNSLQSNIIAFKFSVYWCDSEIICFLHHHNMGLFLACLKVFLQLCLTHFLTYKALPEKFLYSK